MEYHELEQPDNLSKKEKEDAMGAYLMMFAAMGAGLPLPIINLIAAVIYYFVQQKNSRFVKFHSMQSLFSQLPTTLINAGALYWTLQIFFFKDLEISDPYIGYLIMAGILNILYFIFSIIGAVKARKGHMYYFLFFGKLCYHQVYKITNTSENNTVRNQPPM
ncbi:Uncharacterized membrane protein [Reichenbachiella agariperforans]|uniref:Uncharacterized membrane protein n=1 Tax=Reichenbachiella agariperforans TaxID=156994 RepID=A0A1M6JVG1_REIAG|nr:DUF4870 domain-containing protein [Reichenbachiella agariperforans]SHJ50687.1 Uncharacterized membrane protein [Reichenbachiella agariperforans]